MLYFIVIVSRGDRQFIEFIDYLNIEYCIYYIYLYWLL